MHSVLCLVINVLLINNAIAALAGCEDLPNDLMLDSTIGYSVRWRVDQSKVTLGKNMLGRNTHL